MASIQAISFDFADTLYPHRPGEPERLMEAVADYLRAHVPPFELAAMRDRYMAIRVRQLAENRETLRENDFEARLTEVATFLNAARSVDPAVVRGAAEVYADAFVRAMRTPPWLPALVQELASTYRLAVVSNYPASAPIMRTLARDGLDRFLAVIVVSADVGFIKPHRSVFEAALTGLGVPADAVVHVGDTWAADVVGAHQAGMHAVYTRQWRDEADLDYGSGGIRPLAEIDDLRELPDLLRRINAAG
jgi:FMN hydrolase / 5-amino-6-(5-phospho-D-ribitylamino)uracil phosphatase